MKNQIITNLIMVLALCNCNMVLAQSGANPFNWRLNYNSYYFDSGNNWGCYNLKNQINSTALLSTGEMVLAGTKAHNDGDGIDCYNQIEVSKFGRTGQVVASYLSPNSSPSNQWSAVQIVTTANDDIYVLGYRNNISFIMKLNSNLVLQWSKNINSINRPFIQASQSGDIVLAFIRFHTSGDKQIVIKKLNSTDGSSLFTTYLNNKTNAAIDQLNDLKIDRSNNIYICGSVNSVSLGTRFLAVKLDGSGIIQWRKNYDAQMSNTEDIANNLAIDKNLDLIVTGRSWMNNEKYNITTVKFHQNGTIAWARQKDFNQGDDNGIKTDVDGSNNIYVLAQLPSSYFYIPYSAALLKYDINGNLIFSNEFTEHEIYDFAVSEYGASYLVGRKPHMIQGSFPTVVQSVLKISNAGMIKWNYIDTTMTYSVMTLYRGQYTGVLLNRKDNGLWVTGGEMHQFQTDVTYNWLVSYRGVTTRNLGEDFADSNFRIYPNPATNTLQIQFKDEITDAQLTVLDLQGREVMNRTIFSNDAAINVSDLKAGVYFVRIIYEGNVITKKFVKD